MPKESTFFYIPAVSLLILLIHISCWGLVFFPWLWWTSTVGFLNVLLAIFLVIITLFIYFQACFTSPGWVPADWRPENAPEEELETAKLIEADIHSTNKVIFCHKCEKYKPKRAHHCRVCERCILKMDHHCPWINNCVGHGNHKPFMLFLMYATVGLVHVLLLFILRFIDLITSKEDSPIQMMILLITVLYVIPLTITLGYIFLFHLNIILENTTSMETSAKKWQRYDAVQAKQLFHWAYDYGKYGNLKSVFGPSPLLWLVPTPPFGNGIQWKAIVLRGGEKVETFV